MDEDFLRMMWSCLGSILLLLIANSLGEFTVKTPLEPVVATFNTDVILDCQLVPTEMPPDMEVRWFRTDWSQVVHLYRKGKDNLDAQVERYSGRTQLFPDQFVRGNVSLLLRKVNVEDQGRYKCFVVSSELDQEGILDLKVASQGHQPVVRMSGYEGSAIQLGCQSEGWFPEPRVEWRDGEGRLLDGHEDTVEVGMDKLLTVRSSLTVTSGQRGPYKCSIGNTLVGTTTHAQLDISDAFFPSTSGWMVGFWVIFFVLLAGIAAALYGFRRAREQDGRMKDLSNRPTISDYESLRITLAEQETQAELEKQKYLEDLVKQQDKAKAEYNKLLHTIEWGKMMRCAVTVHLDPETANGNLQVTEDLTSVCDAGGCHNVTENIKRFDRFPFVLAQESFTEGRHYWEVTVDSCHNWDLGVARESAERKGKVTLCPEDGYWAIGCSWDRYEVKDKVNVDLHLQEDISRVGIFLNFDDGLVSFHDAGRKRQVHSVSVAFQEPVYPFFCPWRSRTPIRITPVPVEE